MIRSGHIERKQAGKYTTEVVEKVNRAIATSTFDEALAKATAEWKRERRKAEEFALRQSGGIRGQHFRNLMREWENPDYDERTKSYIPRGVWKYSGIEVPQNIFRPLYEKYAETGFFASKPGSSPAGKKLPYVSYEGMPDIFKSVGPPPGYHSFTEKSRQQYWQWQGESRLAGGAQLPPPENYVNSKELWSYRKDQQVKRLKDALNLRGSPMLSVWERSEDDMRRLGFVPRKTGWDFARERLNTLYEVMSGGNPKLQMKYFHTTDKGQMTAKYNAYKERIVREYWPQLHGGGIAEILASCRLLTQPHYTPGLNYKSDATIVKRTREFIDWLRTPDSDFDPSSKHDVNALRQRVRELMGKIAQKVDGWKVARELFSEEMRVLSWRLRNTYTPSHKEYLGVTPYTEQGKRYKKRLQRLVESVDEVTAEMGFSVKFGKEVEELGGSTLLYKLIDWRR
jgi:hypothetical protein